MNGFALVRGVHGVLLVAAPARLLGAAEGRASSPAADHVVQVLGAREVLQALATVARPTRPVLLAGAGADTLHAASALGFAMVNRRWRRAALASAAVAGSFAAAGLLQARRLDRGDR